MAAHDNFVRDFNGRANVSFDGIAGNAGQCVQPVALYVRDYLGKPVIWADAYIWWKGYRFPEHYQRIPNSATAVPQPGDIIVWDSTLPNSGGAGHIAVCVTPRPGTGTFVSFDSNWGGKYCHLVTHNYSYVVGWLRPIYQAAPQPTPLPAVTQGIEMITNSDQANELYKTLRPNGGPSPEEISSTVNKRSFASFISDAKSEVAARDANLRRQTEQLQVMQTSINSQNQVITELNQKLYASNANNEQKTKALDTALSSIAQTNAELMASRDQLKDLQDELVKPVEVVIPPKFYPQENKATLLVRFLALFIKKKP